MLKIAYSRSGVTEALFFIRGLLPGLEAAERCTAPSPGAAYQPGLEAAERGTSPSPAALALPHLANEIYGMSASEGISQDNSV